jgi:uncharacterized protein YjbI with pentapeptide repeats
MAVDTVFYQSNLEGAVFKMADCRRADFRKAKLGSADFTGAKVGGANFVGAFNISAQVASLLDAQGVAATGSEVDKAAGAS